MLKDSNRARLAYMTCAAAFLVMCGLVAPVNALGRILTAIQNDLNTTTIETGWIGSLAWSGTYIVSPLAVVIENSIGHRMTTVLGCVLGSCCYVLASLVTTYIGLLTLLGIICGSSLGLSIHAVVCVIFKSFPPSQQARATSIVFLGISVGYIILALTYEKIVPIIEWRQTLQITSAFSATLSIPASFFVITRNYTSAKSTETTTAVIDEKQESNNLDEVPISSISDKVEKTADDRPIANEKRWLHLVGLWRSWFIVLAIALPAMSWSVYWISYFESISVSADDIFLYVTVASVADLIGKVFIVILPSRLLKAVTLIIISNLLAVIITILFVVWPTKPILVVCSAFIGVGRAWYNILTYKVGVDLLDVANTDQGVTLCMLGLGVGFGIGTLPTGAIFDITGSYTMAFVINAGLYLIGAALLIFLQCWKHLRRKRRRRSRQSVHKNRSSDLQGVDNLTATSK